MNNKKSHGLSCETCLWLFVLQLNIFLQRQIDGLTFLCQFSIN